MIAPAIANAWLEAASDDKNRQAAHGSATAKVEYEKGVPVRVNLTDTVTIQPGTTVRDAAKEIARLLQAIASQLAEEPAAFEITAKLSGRAGRITSANATHTIAIQVAKTAGVDH